MAKVTIQEEDNHKYNLGAEVTQPTKYYEAIEGSIYIRAKGCYLINLATGSSIYAHSDYPQKFRELSKTKLLIET